MLAAIILGLRIDLADVTHAGLPVLSLVLFTMVATICIGYLVSRSLGQTKGFSFIIGVKPLIAMSITTVAMAAIVLAGIFILSI